MALGFKVYVAGCRNRSPKFGVMASGSHSREFPLQLSQDPLPSTHSKGERYLRTQSKPLFPFCRVQVPA